MAVKKQVKKGFFMEKKNIIPATVRKEIEARVEAFNAAKLARKPNKYVPQIKGKFIYLMRTLDNGALEHVCRLAFAGNLEAMEFAIYKYSTEKYDPEECFFDGKNHVDGTLEGAMKAGLKAYPI
jgi:hypothetical protein